MSTRIRSVTFGSSIASLMPANWQEIGQFYNKIETMFNDAGFDVQTRRIVTEPIRPESNLSRASLFSALDSINTNATNNGIRWICLPIGAVDAWKTEDLLSVAPELIRKFPSLFIHFISAENGKIQTARLHTIAKAILDISRLTNNGFDNFRVGTGFNIIPNTPFFPFSWHQGKPGFSLAIESIDELIDIAEKTPCGTPLEELLEIMNKALQENCRKIDSIAMEAENYFKGKFEYKGMDISLAPYPDGKRSVAKFMEFFGPRTFGNYGSVSTTAIFSRLLKKILRETNARNAGFNGVMYSPLEDDGLAQAMKNSKNFTLERLCLYSTVCGCGLDMIPIPGDTLPEDIASLMHDVAVLSSSLNKPLGVRLLPIPMRQANELTDFNHDFLVNTRILPLEGQGLPERFPVKELLLL